LDQQIVLFQIGDETVQGLVGDDEEGVVLCISLAPVLVAPVADMVMEPQTTFVD